MLPDQTAIQMARLRPIGSSLNNLIEIPEHTLYGTYPPKNPEAEVKPSYESGEVVLFQKLLLSMTAHHLTARHQITTCLTEIILKM